VPFALPIDTPTYLTLLAIRHFPTAGLTAYRHTADRWLDEPGHADELFATAERRRIAHVVRWVAQAYPCVAAPTSPFTRFSIVAGMIRDLLLTAWQEVSEGASQRGIPLVNPKGLVFLSGIYPDGCTSFMADIDLLTEPGAIDDLRRLLQALGYLQGLGVREGRCIRLPRNGVRALEASPGLFGQLWPYARLLEVPGLAPHADFIRRALSTRQLVIDGDRVYMLVRIDAHYSLNALSDNDALHDRYPMAEIWGHVRRAQVGPVAFDALDDTTLAWFLPYHFYHEMVSSHIRSVKLLADLAALLRTRPVDFAYLAEMAQRYGHMRPALYYVYRFLQDFGHAPVPSGFVDSLATPTTSIYSDAGDFLPALVGARPHYQIVHESGTDD
jgi:hypothetical protein